MEAQPFLKFSNKKYIITHTTDFINLLWLLSFSTSGFVTFPLFFYHLVQFSKASWYSYQLKLIKKLLFIPFILSCNLLIFCYTNFLPLVLHFLTQWNIDRISNFVNVEVELRLLNYLIWVLTFKYNFIFLIYFFTTLSIFAIFLITAKNIYKIIKYHRKKFSFISILIFFLLAPPDIFLQFFIIVSICLFYEIIFFNICYQVCKLELRKKHAYN